MTSRVVGMAVAGAFLATSAACSLGSKAAPLAEEIGRALGSSPDDVLRTARVEAERSGSSVDDVLGRWRRVVVALPRQGAARYEEVPPEVRSVACGTVTDVLADSLDGDSSTDPQPLQALAESVAGLNQTAGARAMATDLSTALTDLQSGRSATLTLFTLKAGTCQVVAP